MNKVCSSILLFFVLSSCGLEGHKGRNPASNLAVGEALTGQAATISGNRKSIADRICQAFRSKRFSYIGMIGTNFSFLFEEEQCDGDVKSEQIDTTLAQTLASAPLVFDSGNSNPYYKNVETDLHGEISNICNKILDGDDASDLVQLGPNDIKVYDFFVSSDGHDSYTISYAKKDGEEFIVYDKSELAVRTDSAAASLRGLVLRRSQVKVCSGSGSTEIKQTFLKN